MQKTVLQQFSEDLVALRTKVTLVHVIKSMAKWSIKINYLITRNQLKAGINVRRFVTYKTSGGTDDM